MLETIRNLFVYDEWAVTRILNSLESQSNLNLEILILLAHLLVTEKIWLMRLQGEDASKINKSPEMSLNECRNLSSEIKEDFSVFLVSLNAEDLESVITYENFKGAEFRTSVREILMHVAMHGTYHRGQIATIMRKAGMMPVDTDFITFTRETGVK